MKKGFRLILLVIVIFLLLFPFVNTFNQLLTRIVENTGFYRFIQSYISPYLVKIVVSVLNLFGIETRLGESMFLVYKNGQPQSVALSWNCLGWQSLVIFSATLFVGLTGKFTFFSKLECIVLGLMGVFLLNIGRIILTSVVLVFWGNYLAYFIHDYLMIVLTLVWIVVFWIYCYKYVLREKTT